MKNKEVLKCWYDKISHFEKLRLNEAKKLFIEIQKEKNLVLKKQKRERLINGTLYVVINYLLNNGFEFLNNTAYDMNDIINTCNEIWISIIDDGSLLKIKNYSILFNKGFYSKLTSKLSLKTSEIYNDFSFSEFGLSEILNKYIKLREENNLDALNNLMEIYKNDYDKRQIFQLLDSIYLSCKIENIKVEISEAKIEKLIYILIENGLKIMNRDINSIIIDKEDNILNNIIYKEILDLIFKGNTINEQEKEVLKRYYGLYEYDKSVLENIAQEYNVSTEWIRKIQKSALEKLKNSYKIKKYKKILF